MTCINAMAMPSIDTDYSCHIKAVELFNQLYEVYIMPYHTNSLGDRHMCARCRQYQFLENRHASAIGQHAPGFKLNQTIAVKSYVICYAIYCLLFTVKALCFLMDCKSFLVNFCMWLLWNLVEAGNHKHFFGNKDEDVKQRKFFTANNK